VQKSKSILFEYGQKLYCSANSVQFRLLVWIVDATFLAYFLYLVYKVHTRLGGKTGASVHMVYFKNLFKGFHEF
jgi:hypothetical protein